MKMSEVVTLFASRWKPTDYIHLEGDRAIAGPIDDDSVNARWLIEPVSDAAYVRFKSLGSPEKYLHIEAGSPAAGPIGPGWLSAQWQFEPVAGTAYVQIRSRWLLPRYAHIEAGPLDIGDVGPGWLSAQWTLEKVQGTSFVRLRNRWKPDEAVNIESGVLTAGPVGPGWLSAQWAVQDAAGTPYVRLQNRWKPDHYFHIESGRAGASPIAPGWLSAQWLLEGVPGTSFVRLRNRWDGVRYLHIQHGALEAGVIEPGWFSAHWISGAIRTKVIPLALFQRKFDEFVNHRERPLFRFRLHGRHYGQSELTTSFEDPIDGHLKPFGKPVDLGHLEIDLDLPGPGDPLPNPNYHFDDLNTDRVRLTVTSEPADSPPEIKARIDFDTTGEELRINNFPNVDFDGLHITITLRLVLDAANGLVALTTDDESVIADASVDVRGIPDGVVAREIEGKLKSKVVEALEDRLKDQADDTVWQQWTSVSEGSSTPGAPVTTVNIGQDRTAVFIVDPSGGIYTTSGNAKIGWRPWTSVSEGGSRPGAPVTAVPLGRGRMALFIADATGGVYTTSGSVDRGWGPWTNVSEGSTTPGGTVTAVSLGDERIALFLADPNGGVYTNSGRADGGWGGWTNVSEGSTLPGAQVTAVSLGEARVALFIADPNGGIYVASGTPGQWGPWRSLSEGGTTPGAPVSAVSLGRARLVVFVADPDGGIYTASGNPDTGWGPWSNVSEGSSTPGGAVTAVPIGDDQVALFLSDPNGGIYTTSGSAASGWGPWTSVSEGSSTPGAPVGASLVGQGGVTVFVADPNGGIYTTEPGGLRAGLNRRLTRLLLGGDYRVFDVRSDGERLTIGYVVGSQLQPFAEAAQPPLNPGLLSNIDHIVVLMMENRSFDHMLGYLSKHGGRADVDGLHGGETNLYRGREYASRPLPGTQFPVGPCHGYKCVLAQVNDGKLDGFVADFAPRAEKNGVDPGDVMGYYEAGQVPVYDALAREFLICQRWFCSHPGPTFPNRFYGLTARLNRDASGAFEPDNPDFHNLAPVFTRTICDHLTDQGVSWRYYEHGYCFLRLFERYTFDETHIGDARDPVSGFFTAAEAGTLPSVSFIEPDYIDVPPGNDDHPPTDVSAGQLLIAQVVRALINGPLWRKTLLLITYDEHGGFYDHVVPPSAAPVSGIDRYGPRVPAFAVSPWVERGGVSNVVFDHTSILKTIAARFLSGRPPDLGERMAAANDLSMVMLATPRQDIPDVPLPPALSLRDAGPRRSGLTKEGHRDFHRLLQSHRYRFFVD
jgi:hypothetical protein